MGALGFTAYSIIAISTAETRARELRSFLHITALVSFMGALVLGKDYFDIYTGE